MKKLISIFISMLILSAFSLVENSSIRGSVSISGNGLKDVDVVLKKVPGGEISNSGKTDLKGIFLLENVDPGQYNLFISGLNITKAEDNVSGKLQYNGKALQNISVYFYNINNEMKGSVTTDAQGNYNFAGLAVGNYYLKAELTIASAPAK